MAAFVFDIFADTKDFTHSFIKPFADIRRDIHDARLSYSKKHFNDKIIRSILRRYQASPSSINILQRTAHSFTYHIARLEALHQTPHVSREFLIKELLPKTAEGVPFLSSLPALASNPLAIGATAIGATVGMFAVCKTCRVKTNHFCEKLFHVTSAIGRQARNDFALIVRVIARIATAAVPKKSRHIQSRFAYIPFEETITFFSNSNNSAHLPKHSRRRNTPFWKKNYALEFVILAIIAGTVGVFMSIYADTTSNRSNMPIAYQGRLMDASYIPKNDSTYYLAFEIYSASSGGTCKWRTETTQDGSCAGIDLTALSATTSRGLFTVVLGNGDANNPSFGFNFDSTASYLQIYVCPNATPGTTGSCETLTPRKQLGGVTYSYNADLLDGLNYSAFGVLAGQSGGQALIGGTAATDDLTLRTTSGVGASGADMIFQTGNNGSTEAMRILYDGKVGIGTAAPTQTLQVTATVGSPATTGTTQNGIVRIGNSGTGVTNVLDIGRYADSPYGMWMQSGDASNLSLTSVPIVLNPNGGNVGIGTTTPGAPLEVKSAKTTLLPLVVLKNSTGGSEATLEFDAAWPNGTQATSAQIRTLHTANSNGSSRIDFAPIDSTGNWNTRMSIQGDGSVGIGTVTPAAKIDIRGGGALISGTTGTIPNPFGYNSTNSNLNVYSQNSYSITSNIYSAGSGSSWAGGIGFSRSNGSAGSETALASGDTIANIAFAGSMGASSWGYGAGIGATPTSTWSATSAPTALTFSTTPAGSVTYTSTERMRIDSSGNVGIGTTGPSGVLHVRNDTTTNKVGVFSHGALGGSDYATLINDPNDAASYGSTLFYRYLASTATAVPVVRIWQDITTDDQPALQITQDGTGAGLIVDSGYVGIGSTGPAAPLTIKSADTADQSLVQKWFYSGSENVYHLDLKQTVTSGVVRWTFDQTNNSTLYSNVLTLDRGNVGIGTTGPGRKLSLQTTASANASISQNAGSSSWTWYYGPGEGTLSNYDDFQFYTSNGTSPAAVMTFKTSGNVGIGTATPGNVLDISGGGLRVMGATAAASSGAGAEISYSGGTVYYQAYNRASSVYLPVSLAGSTVNLQIGGNNKVIVDANGNVGIGGNTPSAWTTNYNAVQLGSTGAGAFMINNSGGTANLFEVTGNLYFDGTNYKYVNTGYATHIIVNNGSGVIAFGTAGSGTAGTTATVTNYLTIANDGSISMPSLTGGGERYVCVTSYVLSANTACAASDIRLKTNIVDLATKNNVLDSLKQLRGVYFNWKTDIAAGKDATKTKQIGMIAQEVERVFPQLVDIGNDGYRRLQYDKFTAYLLEVAKAQQAILDPLAKGIAIDKKYAGSAFLIIDKDGHIGIGTDKPTATLDIKERGMVDDGIGKELFGLSSAVINGDAPNYNIFQGKAATDRFMPTKTINQLAVQPNNLYSIEAKIIERSNENGHGGTFTLKGTFKTDEHNPPIITQVSSSLDVLFRDTEKSAPSFNISTAGSIKINVTGDENEITTWHSTVFVSSLEN